MPVLPVALAAPAARSQVIYTAPVDVTISAGSTLYFDLGTGGAVGSASLADFPGSDFGLTFVEGYADFPFIINSDSVAEVAYTGYYVSNLGLSDPIDNSLSFIVGDPINSFGFNDANWPAGTTGYLGLLLGNGDYAWAQISYNADKTLTLYDFAYEQSIGVAIAAGDTGSAIPEPATTAVATGLAALLAGSAALYAKRRRKTSEPAAAA